eukprot:380372-Rhodomonas_salina.3
MERGTDPCGGRPERGSGREAQQGALLEVENIRAGTICRLDGADQLVEWHDGRHRQGLVEPVGGCDRAVAPEVDSTHEESPSQAITD